MGKQSHSPLTPSNFPKVPPTYLHIDMGTGPTKNMNTQDLNSATSTCSCQHPGLTCPNPNHLIRIERSTQRLASTHLKRIGVAKFP